MDNKSGYRTREADLEAYSLNIHLLVFGKSKKVFVPEQEALKLPLSKPAQTCLCVSTQVKQKAAQELCCIQTIPWAYWCLFSSEIKCVCFRMKWLCVDKDISLGSAVGNNIHTPSTSSWTQPWSSEAWTCSPTLSTLFFSLSLIIPLLLVILKLSLTLIIL